MYNNSRVFQIASGDWGGGRGDISLPVGGESEVLLKEIFYWVVGT